MLPHHGAPFGQTEPHLALGKRLFELGNVGIVELDAGEHGLCQGEVHAVSELATGAWGSWGVLICGVLRWAQSEAEEAVQRAGRMGVQ